MEILVNNGERFINLFFSFCLEPREIPCYKFRIECNIPGMSSIVGALHDLARAPFGILEAMHVVSLSSFLLDIVVIWSNDSLHAIQVTSLGFGPVGDDAGLRFGDPLIVVVNAASWWEDIIKSTVH